MSGRQVTPDTLSAALDFDHVVRVNADGTLSDVDGVYAPDVDGEDVSPGWELLRGYTGQYGYNGPVMHASEFVGGRMARDILAEPGVYVVVVAYDHTDDPDDDGVAGWAVARQVEL